MATLGRCAAGLLIRRDSRAESAVGQETPPAENGEPESNLT